MAQCLLVRQSSPAVHMELFCGVWTSDSRMVGQPSSSCTAMLRYGGENDAR